MGGTRGNERATSRNMKTITQGKLNEQTNKQTKEETKRNEDDWKKKVVSFWVVISFSCDRGH